MVEGLEGLREIREREVQRTPQRVVIVLDPHEGACDGQHDVVVEATKTSSGTHVAFTWYGSALLSASGTQEFRNALTRALEIGERLRKELA